jgi:peptidoglycan/LPS O-acetylase OafA/YrhL
MKVLPTTRLRSIDALRGIAALGVVFYHAVEQSDKVVPNNLFKYPVRFLQLSTSFGYIGVFLFFVISGFCIHLQWARASANDQEPQIRFGSFWKRRIRRLYPPYLIAMFLFLFLSATSIGLKVTRFFVYDVVMHLLMLHNLDPNTCYSINGVFWTLAIEEQLYLAYFLLLFIRKRWGWGLTLTVCLLARLGWMVFSHVVWLKTGIGVPVPEAAASHWFTWALGAIAVEAWLGLIKLPGWCRNLKLASVLIVAASALSHFLPSIPKDTIWHDVSWFLMHPMWGIGFFVFVNRAVLAEDGWMRKATIPTPISMFATLGLFSYSIYLTHELTIMESWRWVNPVLGQIPNVFLLVLPATILFAWTFFWFCERPFMVRKAEVKADRNAITLLDTTMEPQVSAASD